MEMMGIGSVAAITAIAYLIGIGLKLSPLEDKWIPLGCGLAGAALGLLGLFVMDDFPAGDVLTALAVGIVSGLAATGADQLVKQAKSREK